MTIISLVKSAFGRKATLYTPLNCTKTSSESDLRSAYKKAALRFHPDRANANNNSSDNNNDGDTTLKFQAVSAAYQVLMDEKQRAAYDATGRVLEEHDDDTSSSDSDEGNQQKVPRRKQKRPRNQKQQQWEDFFHSIFNEIISTGSQHENNAKVYSGSVQEYHDVLKYYNMCKGNMQKVLECVAHATQEDISRWRKDIIDPAIYRGEVDDFLTNVNATTTTTTKVLPKDVKKKHFTTLEDSSSSEDDAISTAKRSSSKLKRLKRVKDISKKKSSCLVDTDDDEFEECNVKANKLPRQKNKKSDTNSTAMSMRDKMDYRVAKKRKIKAAKEMEIAKIVQSKNWDGQETKKNRGGASDQLLSQIERKYATKSKSERRNR